MNDSNRMPPCDPDELAQLLALTDSFQEKAQSVRDEVAKVIVGQASVVDEVLVSLLAGGHCIIEGVPGLAKTLLINTLASALSLDFGRIQFTPDLMPADITGTQVISEDPHTGARRFDFQRGPIFVNVLLADEINRTPPKTQAALLEATSEGRVTVAGQRYQLPRPFFVLATQNPIEQEGTYSLPEAQLDRFLLKIVVDYPDEVEEAEILRRTTQDFAAELEPVLGAEEILALQKIVRALHVSDHVMEYAARLVRSTRPSENSGNVWLERAISWGAGPRAVQSLLLAAKARTLLTGRFSVTRGDIRDVALSVLRHRIVPSFQAEGEGISTDDIICRLLLDTPPFSIEAHYDAATRRILRR